SGTQSIPLEIASALFRHADAVLQEAPLLLQVRDELADLERRATVGYKRMFVLKNRHLRSRGLPPLQAYQRALIDVRIAGYIVLGLLSGMRNQELADIRVGCYYETEVDGVTYGWLRSVSRKTGEGATEWMIPPYAGQVIALLERLSQPLREELQAELAAIDGQLAGMADSDAQRVVLLARRTALRQHQHGLFLGKTAASGNIAILSLFSWNAELKRFARNHGIPWQPTTHELRRTFAVFVAAHGRGNLLYLRDHFKHWSLDMTALYALNETQDVDLYAEILEKMEQEQAVRIASWLDPEVRLAGKAGERIMRQRVHMKSMNMVSRKEMAERAGQGILLRSTGHSWCMADVLSCGGRGLYDAMECADCSHAVIDETQRDTWHGLWLQQLELREVNDIGPAAQAKIEESIATVKQILRKLDPGVADAPGKEPHVAS
ncbi:hypothetical protein, partial [Noviherbaspirillum denitrificans]|uniref:hypothetical protein n=2 Tax=Noviherbaspirillum denitrificans TaxID=1968433 RepID=UPI000B5369BB